MNTREARRQATRWLARSARQLCAEVGTGGRALGGGFSHADRIRLVNALNALTHELDVRAGDAVRTKRLEPVDPLQEVLFETD